MTHPDFIEVYDQVLDSARCAALIAGFERSGQARRGATGGGVDVTAKDSWDIQLDAHPGWKDAERMLNRVVMEGFRRYLRRYAHIALAPFQLKRKDPATDILVALTADDLAALDDASLDRIVLQMFRPGSINLQKYLADQGGYPYWHCELYPHRSNDQGESLHRVLLWTIYLNDAFEAGETEFLYQERSIAPKTGSLLIAPAAFTHTHRGNMPRGGDKFIATSWILFNRAEKIYAPAAPPA
jgi:hypothetical protein